MSDQKSNTGFTRRRFLAASALAGAAVAAPGLVMAAGEKPFRLKYAPHDGLFKNSAGSDIVDQIHYAADQGFTAWEDNGMKGRKVSQQERIAKALKERGMQMGVFVAADIDWKKPTLTTGEAKHREAFLEDVRESVEVAKRVNATWMTVVPGFVDLRLQPEFQTANVVESLKQASAILEPHGLVMVLEPLNFHNHPGMWLSRIPQAYQVCKAVDSPACKILFDIYHQQIQEGNIIPNIDRAWDEIAYFQVGDNPGRNEPTTGEVNYRNVFRHIHGKGFEGVLGMEHGKSIAGKEGEQALIEAYRHCDAFEA